MWSENCALAPCGDSHKPLSPLLPFSAAQLWEKQAINLTITLKHNPTQLGLQKEKEKQHFDSHSDLTLQKEGGKPNTKHRRTPRQRRLSKQYSEAFRDWQAEPEQSRDMLLTLFAMPVCCSFRALHLREQSKPSLNRSCKSWSAGWEKAIAGYTSFPYPPPAKLLLNYANYRQTTQPVRSIYIFLAGYHTAITSF